MRAIVLSAGQGRRLLPLTRACPKCLLPVRGDEPMLGLQLEALARCGIERTTLVIGFEAERIERYVARRAVAGMHVETLYNPFFGLSDNLVSCWLAREAMTEDFVLLNGDTLFDDAVLANVLAGPGEITLAIDRKGTYDADDMKVSLTREQRLRAIGKDLPRESVDAEAVGLGVFRGSGPKQLAGGLDRAVREPGALGRWYVTALDELAGHHPIEAVSVAGHWWTEIDAPSDLGRVRARYQGSSGAIRGMD